LRPAGGCAKIVPKRRPEKRPAALGDAAIESSATRSILRLEARLADLFGYAQAVLFGRGRAGLAALMQGIGPGGTLVLPSNICPVLHVVAHAGGWHTRLCPIDPRSGLADDRAMADLIAAGGARSIAMPANLYGFTADYPLSRAAARERGWLMLENDTMASRGRPWNGGKRTADGDALLVSFGAGKTIEAGGGGAILTDDDALADELRHTTESFPPLDDLARAREDWTLAFRLLLKQGFPGGPPMAGLSEHLLAAESRNLRHSFVEDLGEPLSRALDEAAEIVKSRREKADLWARALAPLAGAIKPVELEQPAPWRLARIRFNPGRILRQRRSSRIRWA